MIPEQLKDDNFRFVLLGRWNQWKNSETNEIKEFSEEYYNELDKNKKWKPLGKTAFELDWQIKNNYKWNDLKLINHIIKGNNIGIIGGFGELRILDIDDLNEVSNFDEITNTFTVETGSKGRHYYYTSKYEKNIDPTVGEFRADRRYVVCPPSKHPNSCLYNINKNIPIQNITEKEIIELLRSYFRKDYILNSKINISDELKSILEKNKSIKNLMDGNVILTKEKYKDVFPIDKTINKGELQVFLSASEAEQSLVDKLVSNGFSKEQIFQLMVNCKLGNWQSNPISYRELTYRKALGFVTVEKSQDKKELLMQKTDKLPQRQTIKATELMSKNFPPHEYYIDKFIPKNSIILIGGKSGKFKTGLALSLLLSMTKGQSFLDIFPVLEQPKILYYELDNNGDRSLMWKTKYILRGNNYNESILDRLTFEREFYKERLIKELEYIKDYDIIILDSYRRFLSGDENESRNTNNFFVDFLKKVKEAGKTIIVLHHFKKSKLNENPDIDLIDAFRGSSDIVSQFDVVYGITKTDDKENVDLKTTSFDVFVQTVKDRDDAVRKQFNFNVLKDENSIKTILKFTGYNKPIELFNKIEKTIIEYLKIKNEATREEVIKNVKNVFGCSVSVIDKGLKELISIGEITSPYYGKYAIKPQEEIKISKKDSILTNY